MDGKTGAGPASTTLVPVDDDVFLAIGDRPPTNYEVLPLGDASERLADAVCVSLGAANVGLQALDGSLKVQGLVRLAPETLQALKAGAQPLTKGGWNLGTLVNEGKFAHQVRWLPAGSAQMAAVAAQAGTAITMLAIQWQLDQITKLVRQNIELTSDVLHEVRSERWAEVRADHDIVMQELRRAQRLGAVTPANWQALVSQGIEKSLRKHERLFRENLQRQNAKLARVSGVNERREWVSHNAEAVLRDLDGLVLARATLWAYNGLRAGAALAEDPDSLDAVANAKDVLETARDHARLAAEDMRPLVQQLYRQFRLMELCPGSPKLSFGRQRFVAASVSEVARALAEQVEQLSGSTVVLEPPRQIPLYWDLPTDKDLDALLQRIIWVIEPGERLETALWGTSHLGSLGFNWQGFLVATDRRVLLLDEAPFFAAGSVQESLPWDDVETLAWLDGRAAADSPIVVRAKGRTHEFFARREFGVPSISNVIYHLGDVKFGKRAQARTRALDGDAASRI